MHSIICFHLVLLLVSGCYGKLFPTTAFGLMLEAIKSVGMRQNLTTRALSGKVTFFATIKTSLRASVEISPNRHMTLLGFAFRRIRCLKCCQVKLNFLAFVWLGSSHASTLFTHLEIFILLKIITDLAKLNFKKERD